MTNSMTIEMLSLQQESITNYKYNFKFKTRMFRKRFIMAKKYLLVIQDNSKCLTAT